MSPERLPKYLPVLSRALLPSFQNQLCLGPKPNRAVWIKIWTVPNATAAWARFARSLLSTLLELHRRDTAERRRGAGPALSSALSCLGGPGTPTLPSCGHIKLWNSVIKKKKKKLSWH